MFDNKSIENALKTIFGVLGEMKDNLSSVILSQKLQGEQLKQQGEQLKHLTTELVKANERITSVAIQLTKVEGKVDLLVQGQQETSTKIDFLVSELSRYKNDSGEMLLSMYAFCNIYGINFSYGNDSDEHSLANMGKKATRYSRQKGYVIETTADPRFGKVMLYDPRALEDLFLGEED
jgi:chromosome segregation ATPase